jgi:hypothetical protein
MERRLWLDTVLSKSKYIASEHSFWYYFNYEFKKFSYLASTQIITLKS